MRTAFMDGFRFNDLKRMTQIGIYFSAAYLAFSEREDDIEVVFTLDDGRAIQALLQKSLDFGREGTSAVHDGFMTHRFRNLDGDENAAFRAREELGGIDLTLASGLENSDGPLGADFGGMSVCISKADATTLTEAFSESLKSLK
jgi:hypothetical protein